MHFSGLFEHSSSIISFLTALLRHCLHIIKSPHLKQYVIFTKVIMALKSKAGQTKYRMSFLTVLYCEGHDSWGGLLEVFCLFVLDR
jgi:hypothetical protein